MKVADLVALGRFPHRNWMGTFTANDRQLVWQAIESVGLAHLANSNIHEISDGERQRAMIARTRERFAMAGLEPVTWLSPARQQSFNTPDLLTEAGFTRVLDWESDSVPLSLRTAHGPMDDGAALAALDAWWAERDA
jgi:hypothetical protein